jgi:hypothetical protein
MKPVLKRLSSIKVLQKIYKDSISVSDLKRNIKLAMLYLVDYIDKDDSTDCLAAAVECIIVADMIDNNLEKEAKECMNEYNKAIRIIK